MFHFYIVIGKSKLICTCFESIFINDFNITSPKETILPYSSSYSSSFSVIIILCYSTLLISVLFPHPEGPNTKSTFFLIS